MNWIEVPAGKYSLLSETAKRSLCQIEISVRYVSFYTSKATTNGGTGTTHSSRTRLRMLGHTLPLCGFLASISNALVGKAYFPKLKWTL